MDKARAAFAGDRTVQILQLAQRYGSLSNTHDLKGIGCLIAETAEIYGFAGKPAILHGMADFRRRFPKVWWRFGEFKPLDQDRVSFDFERYWTDAETGRVRMCTAEEVIAFGVDNLIVGITYSTLPSAPQDAAYPQEAAPVDFDPTTLGSLD
jgi:hypothetical protein